MAHPSHDSANIYFRHFRAEHQKISAATDKLQQKILTVTLLDALARGRYKSVPSNKERFVNLVENYGGWPDADRVSPSQYFLSVANHKRVCKVRGIPHGITTRMLSRALTAAVSSRSSGAITPVSKDPSHSTLMSLGPTKEEQRLLFNNKHSCLLYYYRTRLVHEYREPGYGIEFRSDGEPFYHWHEPVGQKPREELVYPRAWLRKLPEPILRNLEAYYRKARRAPHAQYDFGSHWLERRK